MHWGLAKGLALATLLQSISALPATNKDGGREIVKTTKLKSGEIIDWVNLHSQGDIASPPPMPAQKRNADGTELPPVDTLIPSDPGLSGPKGAVPFARTESITKPEKRLPEKSDDESFKRKGANPAAAATNAGQHWYASTAQAVSNHGGKAIINLWNAFVQSPNDFSLLQTAVIRYNVPVSSGGTTMQTVEAGWINYQAQIQAPHLFTFFTTNGYNGAGNNVGGWNTEQGGWVQVDSTIYPGIPFSPLSSDGGTQYEFQLEYQLFQGNWWLFILDRWIGYYPASIFTNGVASGSTLESESNQINYYGEIFNSEDALTTTDMGSGNFPESGIGHAAYMRSLTYTDTSQNSQNYDGSAQVIVSDSSRYRILNYFNSGTSYGSYFILGGPGAGGVVNG